MTQYTARAVEGGIVKKLQSTEEEDVTATTLAIEEAKAEVSVNKDVLLRMCR